MAPKVVTRRSPRKRKASGGSDSPDGSAISKSKVPQKKAPKKRAPAPARKLAPPLPVGVVLSGFSKREWKLGKSIGKGGFGEIYEATSATKSSSTYVVKVEPQDNGPLFTEISFYRRAAAPESIAEWIKSHGLEYLAIPQFIDSGKHTSVSSQYRFLVMERFGDDIGKLFSQAGNKFGLKTVCYLALRILEALEYLHQSEYVHADIKGTNLLTGYSPSKRHQVYLVDYGLAFRYSPDGEHKAYKPDPRRCHDGTIEFTSIDAHDGANPSRRGDLEILGYCLLQWLCGKLPWEDYIDNKPKVATMKRRYKDAPSDLMKDCFKGKTGYPKCLLQYMECVYKLSYDEQPHYEKLKKLFLKELKDNNMADNSTGLDWIVGGEGGGAGSSGRKKKPPPATGSEVIPKSRGRKVVKAPCNDSDPDSDTEVIPGAEQKKKRAPAPDTGSVVIPKSRGRKVVKAPYNDSDPDSDTEVIPGAEQKKKRAPAPDTGSEVIPKSRGRKVVKAPCNDSDPDSDTEVIPGAGRKKKRAPAPGTGSGVVLRARGQKLQSNDQDPDSDSEIIPGAGSRGRKNNHSPGTSSKVIPRGRARKLQCNDQDPDSDSEIIPGAGSRRQTKKNDPAPDTGSEIISGASDRKMECNDTDSGSDEVIPGANLGQRKRKREPATGPEVSSRTKAKKKNTDLVILVEGADFKRATRARGRKVNYNYTDADSDSDSEIIPAASCSGRKRKLSPNPGSKIIPGVSNHEDPDSDADSDIPRPKGRKISNDTEPDSGSTIIPGNRKNVTRRAKPTASKLKSSTATKKPKASSKESNAIVPVGHYPPALGYKESK